MTTRGVKAVALAAMLLFSGMASAQVVIKGSVYGGGLEGQVKNPKVESNIFGNDTVTINDGTIEGSVYGGGKGVENNETSGLVQGNTTVIMTGGCVERSIYGGGSLGSVGTFSYDSIVHYTEGQHAGLSVPFPTLTGWVPQTGKATVSVTGGTVGLRGSLMPWTNHDPNEDDRGWIFCGSRGEADSITYPKVIAMGVVKATHLVVDGSALVTASAYGGCENGLVLDSTFVEIKGGQIGTGLIDTATINNVLTGTFADPYLEDDWNTAIQAVKDGTIATVLAEGGALHDKFYMCDSWPYGYDHDNDPTTPKKYDVYDIYYDPEDPSYAPANTDTIGSNGQSYFGNVFGGGSGYYPIAPGIWRRTAGRVNGNTRVEITGGHILTSVYGGNEVTDVMGRTTIKMSDGTIGVPRSNADIQDHPVLCNLFGSGKGDQRVWANKWTNVDSTIVEFTGGTIFGSIFGGGEDGHVLGSTYVTVNGDNALIGTLGYTGFEGHVYGSGRGFSGDALTAGNVGGNTNITIESGTILGSVYGGGRNASVGPKLWNTDDLLYGQMQPDDNVGTHGHTHVTINGGVIGNDYESKLHRIDNNQGGNVYGGSMGTFTLLDGSLNPMWPRMSKVKTSNVTIDGENTIIKGSVFGGCKLGTVVENTSVTIKNGTIWRSVYGSGYGSDNNTYVADNVVIIETPDEHDSTYQVTPRRHAGRVYGNTKVSIEGGWVKKNVYGGGNMASTGTITNEIVVQSEIDSLSIGWPVRLTYKPDTGADTVLITGGRIGITGNDFMGPWNTSNQPYDTTTGNLLTEEQINAAREVNGQVFGGGRGSVGNRREMAELADYVKTVVTVNYASTASESGFKPNASVSTFYSKYSEWTDYGSIGCIVSNLYGASENGHVHDSTYVTLTNGLIGGSLFGGGKGTDMYLDDLWVEDNSAQGYHIKEDTLVHSVTAGKVFGKTYVTMDGGHVLGNVYGGGEFASVGKGNYLGYGEHSTAEDSTNMVLKSGKCYVAINGGTVGTATWNHNGNVFGSSKGLTYKNVTATPRYNYSRDFFLGYTNFAYVTIGKADGATPRIYGSVFGGGESGHVRFNTEVTINKGEIGVAYNSELSEEERTHRGNIYGAGQGMDKIAGTDDYCNSAGSVTLNTKVTVNGGTIHRNVYGGGSLASVGPPPTGYNPGTSLNEVIIKGGTIGEVVTTVTEGVTTYSNYGGDVFGAGRGIIDPNAPLASFATSSNTSVILDSVMQGATPVSIPLIIGNVYGGGEYGQVKKNTSVNVKAGYVGTIGYTWKHDTDHGAKMDSVFHKTGGSVFGGGRGDLTDPVANREAALVTDTTHVTISGGHVQRSVYGGGEVASVGLREQHDYKYNEVSYTDYLPKQSKAHADSTGVTMVTILGGQVGPAPKVDATHNVAIGLNGVDGYVFGGGKGIGEDPIPNPTTHPYSGGSYYAIADVNNTYVTVDMPMPVNATDTTNRIWGSTFGGAEDGHVLGSARTYYKNGLMGTTGTTTYDGNIFGGGRNYSKKNYNAGRVRVNDSIDMCGGQIYGSIFGGGRLALTGIDLYGNMIPDTSDVKHGNTFVKVSGGIVGNDTRIEEWIASSMGDVYGAGKGDTIGVYGHPKASALLVSLVKNTEVLITDTVIGGVRKSPRILGSVFGGGEVANVGHFTWNIGSYSGALNIGDIQQLAGTGKTKVTVRGGVIGADKAQMRVEMAAGTGNYNLKYNDDRGHVFGGGEGWVDDPTKYAVVNPSSSTPGIHNNKRLIDLMAVVGETEVTISDTAFVKGSVYGGAMSGHVLRDTKVTVSGGQIGAGYDKENDLDKPRYKDKKFFNPVGYFARHTTDTDIHADSALFNCYRWDYVAENQRPFDPIALKSDPVANKPTNGETWFGHVFGGGSGYYPYIVRNQANTADSCVWNPDAGKVFGHTEVEITGGHILSNVYGGNQTTDVGNYIENGTTHQLENNSDIAQAAKTIVTMSGGTVGVPRIIDSIQAYPFTSSVYGGGQGNFADHLKALNNVESTRVVISDDALVYGSVFGGSQNAHVLDSAKVLINGGVIGTTGLSGYDGNVFGGGQGTVYINPHYADDTLYAHAGRVGGNTRILMSGGKVLGNLYGGGMVALTGVDLNGWFDAYTDGSVVYDSTNHGMAKVELSGGFVGNDFNHGRNILTSSYPSGNVYGGGRGKLNEYHQDDLGRLANSAVEISGSPTVYGSVFGGGEMANVGYWRGYDLGWYATKTATTRVTITGSPTIGTELEFKDQQDVATYAHNPGNWTHYDTIRFVKYGETTNDTTYLRMLAHTRTGNVYGGGQGDVRIVGASHNVMGLEQGHCANTKVNIGGTPTIRGSVFGGSEEGVIWGETEVHIAGGTIGTTGIVPDSLKYNHATQHWDGPLETNATYYYGSVFGGSYGKDYYSSFNIASPRQTMIDSVNILSGRVYGNTLVDITGGTIRGNVFGGGNMASVGIWDSVKDGSNHFVDIKPIADPVRTTYRGNATVTVNGSSTVIGPLDGTGLNAYVFGGGKGFANDPTGLRKEYANVDSTFVTVSGGTIWGSVFGGGSDSHVLGSTSVTVHSGANIGTDGLSTWDGNIFGGGRNFQNTNHTNGRVAGNIDINMDGGTLQGSIFGGGRLALTGVNVDGNFLATNWDVTKHGNVNIEVSGDATTVGDVTIYSTVIGNDSDQGIHLLTGSEESVGDIFGSGKGDTKAYMDTLGGRVTNATISIIGSPRIHGAVFGGGEMASLGWWGNDHQFIANTGEATITIGRVGQNDNPVIGTYLELDSDYLNDEFEVNGQQYDHSDWTMIETVDGAKRVYHTCTGNVFGGCQGDVDFEDWETEPNHWPYMGRSKTATITVNGGTIIGGVFGGPEQGTMDGNATITINDGNIGSVVTDSNNKDYNFGGVYGAGYGSDDIEEDNLNVTVYGTTLKAKERAGRVYGNTLVNVLGGLIKGDVFGGASFAYVGGEGENPNGNVQVNIGKEDEEGQPIVGSATILGSVFGSNNHSGTPLGYVNVDVYHTAHRTWEEDDVLYTNYAPILTDTVWSSAMLDANINGTGYFHSIGKQCYAIKEVFAGGNHASYTPNETRGVRDATVHVHYCENTIEDLYGGSNAADIGTSDVHANDSVIVDGGRFYRVFGGGNGTTTFANVHGTAVTRINAGVIQEVFGGGNHNGIIDDIDLEITHDNAGTCGDFIYDVFGGNNEAEVIGDIVSVINCGDGYQYEFYGGNNTATIYGNVTTNVFGGETAYLFGGSKGSDDVQAHIRQFPSYAEITADTLNHYLHPNVPRKYSNTLLEYMGYPDGPEPDYVHTGGNVTLNIFGGTISEAAFGGSDENGTIDGKITVNVFDADIACALDLNNLYGAGRKTSYEPIYDLPTGTTERISPEINVIHGTVKGYVYGGGKGNEATTKASPKVNIGYDALTMGPPTTEGTLIDTLFGTIHHYVDTIKPEDPEHSYHWQAPAVADYAAKVKHNVYGGGELAQVAGNTRVNIYAGVVGDSIGHIENHLGADSTFLGLYAYQLQGGRVFGGGEGSETNKDHGLVTGNATVTMTGGKVYKNVYGGGELASVGTGNLTDKNSGVATVIISGGEVGPLDGSGENAYVFGGGRGKVDSSSPTAYGDFANVDSTSVIISDSARIYGSVFGGSEDGHVLGDARMQILGKTGTKDTIPLIGTNGMTSWDGNLFGGGRNFRYVNFTAGRVGGNTTIEMNDGTVLGNIYGGGRLALTGVNVNGIMQTDDHGNTKVMVKGGTVGNAAEIETFTWSSMGNIYGGGKGYLDTYNPSSNDAEKSLLLGLTKNTSIEISDTLGNNTHVYGIVLGGGEIASVGRYVLYKDLAHHDSITSVTVPDGGLATVKISGGIIGGDRSQMRYELEDPTDPDDFYLLYNDDLGYVYGGGEGWSADPADYDSIYTNGLDHPATSLIDLIATVQRTEVTITNDTTVSDVVSRPWVKASVFGGAESGHVMGNAKVTIAGGQIGAGYYVINSKIVDSLYNENQFFNPLDSSVLERNSLHGTFHWDYGHDYGGATHYDPFDPVDIHNGYSAGTNTYTIYPSDGKSWFGNVFGGGSGWFPYQKKNASNVYQSYWNAKSGKVWGNTEVIIKGGHILNNVYGANESTDVGGKATVTMSGGTVGVPRTAAQVNDQPVTCYVFGGGCGDPRDIFDNETNVAETDVQITGGIIYGSVYGGAEDGHVLGNVNVTIDEGEVFTVGEAPNAITYTYPVIGSTGTSGADGNLFGGGRNFFHENNEAGRVEGNINIDMDGGVFLGSIYGGGRMGSTGVNVSGENITTDPTLYGNVTIDISGGTVGNRSQVLTHTATSIGDVFGGGKGNSASAALGRVRNTNVKISGDAKVLNNVYGGGELANVGWATTPGDAFDSEKGGLAKIEISGGQVGIEQIGTAQATIKGGNVFGGGLGLAGGKDVVDFANVDTTRVVISGGYITNSVFGGADNGHVWRNTSIEMTSGTVGQRNTLDELTVNKDEQPTIDNIYTGSVIGGGRGVTPVATSPTVIYNDTTGIVFGNTTIDIKGDAVVRKGVYGGGGLSHVGTFTRDASGAFTSYTKGKCTVSVMGNAHIGPTKADLDSYTETDKYNFFFNNLGGNAGWVFGAGCGLPGLTDLTFCDSTFVTIGGTAQVTGAVFGGGENGHVKTNTRVLVSGGTIGGIPLHDDVEVNITEGAFEDVNFTATKDELAEDEFGAGPRVLRGFVYGGGKGNDFVSIGVYDPHAGQVYGNSKVEITNGTIYSRVFGGGLLASVGTFNYAASNTDSIVGVVDNTGLAKVIVSGGTIGTDGNNNGDVLGGGRGQVGRHWEPNYTTGDQVVNLAYVGNTEVTIKGTAQVKSNVYGGSGSGHVQEDAHVIIEGGTIGIENHGGWHSNVYGGGGGQHQYVRNSSTNPPTMHHSITSGRVFGNTTVEIKGGTIYHNVYGGGAIASVGTYNIYATTMEGLFKPGTGDTEVTITGGTIGVDGDNNGMVFGSGRGQIAPIDAFMDSLSYAVNTVVNIGKETTQGSGSYEGTAKIKGSVYGSGENGHVFKKATVNVYSGTIGCEPDTYVADHFAYRGNVYGSGCGTDMYDSNGDDVVDSYNPRSGIVQGNTEVNIKGGHISRNVYGGGAMASVGSYNPYVNGGWGNIAGTVDFTGKAVVNVSGGTIGTSDAPEGIDHGNVFGGSRGPNTGNGFTNFALTDTSYVFISGTANVLGSVYGGGAKSWTRTARVATVSGGTVEKDVFGGSQNGLDDADTQPFTSLKTVNVRNGHIKGNVFGCSDDAVEGDPSVDVLYNPVWTSFVNITGGNIDQNVYGAGKDGTVHGSVCVNIGATAVKKAPTKETVNSEEVNMNKFMSISENGTPVVPAPDTTIVIGGSVYAGSQGGPNGWKQFDISQYAVVYIDGKGYDTKSETIPTVHTTDGPYMNIAGGLIGSGTHCESGSKGRQIVLKNYGHRNADKDDEFTSATRSLTTIQRCGHVLLDSTNVKLSGAYDITVASPSSPTNWKYGVFKVDTAMYVSDGSGIVLGAAHNPVYMDSIRVLKSVLLAEGTIYDSALLYKLRWDTIGIMNNDNKLHRIHNGSATGVLESNYENVIIFNDTSRLWVRYTDKKPGDAEDTTYYGELQGFFRMRADSYEPRGSESFAYARPKITDGSGNDNISDGGFLSYQNTYNYFIDNGAPFTKTKQYPYVNVLGGTRADRTEYRLWAYPNRGNVWYVDGRPTGGWGDDDKTKKEHEAGLYPDKPKKTLFAAGKGVVTETYTDADAIYNYSYKKDQIYVVGALSEFDGAVLRDSIGAAPDRKRFPLRLYRYPGGHAMSNGETDEGNGSVPATWGGVVGSAGPGANYGALLDVPANTSIQLKGVVMDGLSAYTLDDENDHMIPASFDTTKVTMPLVITHSGSKLTLQDSTVLQRGYNGNSTDATAWFDNSAYDTPADTYHGGALFVDAAATVNVSDTVFITGNKQKKGEGYVESNVFIPTFAKYLNVTDTLSAITRIGVTKPRRNDRNVDESDYTYNTFSPVAVVATSEHAADTARNVWRHNNFYDDMDMFFVNGYTNENQRSTYYSASIPDYPSSSTGLNPDKTLFFGWTWNNVVRTAPTDFAVANIDSKEDLAWLASVVNGLNGQSGVALSSTDVLQTADLDMKQYVWVPVGQGEKPFSGTFDGQGHLIKNLSVDYIGTGDRRYGYSDYGLFGKVSGGSATVDRTFVVSGIVRPNGNANIGGLVGLLDGGTLKNSEAADSIVCPDQSGSLYAGGLVGRAANGAEIHSSMAMPSITAVGQYGYIGGLLGGVSEGSASLINAFANAKFTLGDNITGAGGLAGHGSNLTMKNCYINLFHKGNLESDNRRFGLLLADGNANTTLAQCFHFGSHVLNKTYNPAYNGDNISEPSNCGVFKPVTDADNYGYMYSDNTVYLSGVNTAMFKVLNDYIITGLSDATDKKYARWARPTLGGINGDYPVLMIGNYNGSGQIGAGDFRSVASIAGSHALQYGGTVRDGSGHELSTMLGRAEEVFVYGDVKENLADVIVNASKVAIHEDAAILKPGALGSYGNNYVGVTFDNSSRHAVDAYGNILGRDWHMFSTPLANAPLGINYDGENVADGPRYNPWDGDDSDLPEYAFYSVETDHIDGYFPSKPAPEDEYHYSYPYDFRCWYEPDWQWINFKRNGPSHWHYDEEPGTTTHHHIDYKAHFGSDPTNPSDDAPANVNEENFVPGKGYMMAIQEDTYLQSHGNLSSGNKSFTITNSYGSASWTWVPEAYGYYGNNLVGNPYHAYLNFDEFGTANSLSTYYIYAADDPTSTAKDEDYSGYMFYVKGGSRNGFYAPHYIHPHQGFFVQKDYEEGPENVAKTITFAPSHTVTRAVAGTSPFRDRPNYKLVNLFAYDQEGLGDVVVIEFERPEFGGGPKIKTLRNGNHLIYAHHDTTDYGAFFAKQELRRIPVRFKSFEEENTLYTLKWDLQNGYFPTLYLVDNMTGTIYDMTRNDTYLFSASKEDYLSRFYIVFDYNDVEEFEETNTFAFFNGSAWVVNGKGYVELFDVTGRCLYTNTLSGDQSDLYFDKLAKGVYMLRLSDGFTVRTQKIVIQ